MSGSVAISARDLCTRFPRRRAEDILALDGLTLDISSSSWTALLGPNGSGKSTLLKSVTRAVTPASGELRVLGADASTSDASVRRRLGVVFQAPGLDRLLTIRENLLTQCALFGWSGAAARERVAAHAESVGLTDRLNDRVGSLSGGLARRADLARALLSEPDLLLLDEPTNGLDPEARASFLDLLERTRAARPAMTLVMSTHLMDEAERCDTVALLGGGRLIAHETPEALRADLGERALHTAEAHASTLEQLGLRVRSGDGRAVATGDLDLAAHASAELTRASVEFEVRSPSLEDVYLAHAGNRSAGGGDP